MGAPGYAVFCSTGHLVKSVGHHEIDDTEITECSYCKSTKFYTQMEWGDSDYEQFVPCKPIAKDGKELIFDISRLVNFEKDYEERRDP